VPVATASPSTALARLRTAGCDAAAPYDRWLRGDAEHRRRGSACTSIAMLALCETVECRRVQLLWYFGDLHGVRQLRDTCPAPPESWDGTEPAQLLSTHREAPAGAQTRSSSGQIVDIPLGRTPRAHHAERPRFAVDPVSAPNSEISGESGAREALGPPAQGCFAVQVGSNGTPVVTEASATCACRQPTRKQSQGPCRILRVELPVGVAPVFERLRSGGPQNRREAGSFCILPSSTMRRCARSPPALLDTPRRTRHDERCRENKSQVWQAILGGALPHSRSGRADQRDWRFLYGRGSPLHDRCPARPLEALAFPGGT
jgi:hypothetical protein